MPHARRPGVATPGLHLKLVFAFFVLAAVLQPLGHQHVACHLKSSTHCNICHVGSAAEAAAEPAAFDPVTLTDAGDPAFAPVAHVESAPRCTRSGRAPPFTS